MYPSTLPTHAYHTLPPPASLIDRARRLYVLSPLFDPDPDVPYCTLSLDHASHTAFYSLDLYQGERATLAVNPRGVVLAGVVGDASARMWYTDDEIRRALRTVADDPSRGLLRILHHPEFVIHWGRSFCLWWPPGGKQWRAAPEMLEGEPTPGDHLGLCQHLAAPPEFVVAFAEDYTESKPTARLITRYLADPHPTVKLIERMKNVPDHILARMKERAWTAQLHLAPLDAPKAAKRRSP